jgi:hypothetical protein
MLARISVLLVGLAALLAGCGESELRGTPGQLQTLRFEHTAGGSCPGCDVNREILAGSLLDIDVHGVHPRVGYEVRSTAPAIAEFAVSTRCRFVGEDNCRDGIAIVAKVAGDADLEVYDEWTETVLDRITIKVRDAASIDTIVKAGPGQAGPGGGSSGSTSTALQSVTPSGGVFEITVDSDVEIATTARSASGAVLIATREAMKSAYADEQVVGPRSVVAPIAAEYAKAKRPGTTSISVMTAGAREELFFRVVD